MEADNSAVSIFLFMRAVQGVGKMADTVATLNLKYSEVKILKQKFI